MVVLPQAAMMSAQAAVPANAAAASVLARAAMQPVPRQTMIGAGEVIQDMRAPQGQALRGNTPVAPQEIGITAQDLAGMPITAQEGIFAKALNFLNEGIFGRIFQADFFIFGATAVLGIVMAPVTLVGKLIGKESVATFGQKLTAMVAAPREEVMHTALTEGLSTLATRGGNKVAARFGEEHFAARGLKVASSGLSQAEAATGRGMQMAFNGAATSIGSVAQNSGVRGWLLNKASLKSAQQRGGLGHVLTGFETALNEHAATLSNAVSAEGQVLTQPLERTFRGIGEAATSLTAAEHTATLQGGLKTLKNAVSGAEGTTAHMVETAMRQMKGATTALGEIHAKTEGYAGSTALASVNNAMGGIDKIVDKAGRAMRREQTLANIPEALREMPTRLGRVSMFNAAMNTAVTLGTIAQGYNAYTTIRAQWGALCRMCADLEGTKTVSSMHLLFGDIPKPVAEARSQLFKEALPKLGLEGVMAAMNVQMLRGKMNTMLAMPMFMAPMLASSFLVKEAALVKNYDMLTRAHKANIPIHPSAYCSLILSASQDVAKNLEAQKDGNGLLNAVAQEYLAAKMAPKDVLLEIGNGKFNDRATRLQAEMAVKGRKPGELTAEAKAELEAAKANDNKAHAEQAAPAANQNKEVLGKHTAQVTAKAANAAAKPAMPVIQGMTPNPVISGTKMDVAPVKGPGVAITGAA